MTGSDNDSKFDETERDRLQAVVSALETALAVSSPASRSAVERGLQGAKGRVEFLNKKIKDAQIERENHAHEQAAMVATLAERETRLNSDEKRTYAGFLEKGFFTKSDFGSLDQFYAKTWDRLSESGKNEMSHRVWEGIRHGEYKFTDLPKTVREKETDRAYSRLSGKMIGTADESRIPANDREDFIRTYEAGKRDEAGKILDRESFKQNMYRENSSEMKGRSNGVSSRNTDVADAIARVTAAGPPAKPAPATPGSDHTATLDLSSVNLDGFQLAEAKEQTKAAEIPSAKPGASPQVSGGRS